MYGLTLSKDNRVLSVGIYHQGFPDDVIVVDTLPDGDPYDYLYINGQYVYDPLPEEPEKPSHMDILEAQVTYTAMMTDTLLEV